MNRPSSRTTRTGILAGLWIAAAAGALLLGLTAVSSIGSGLSGGSPVQPLAAEDVEARLAAPETAPRPGGTQPGKSQPAAAQPAGPQQAEQSPPAVVPAGPAGTVLVRCAGGTPTVVSVNPAQGFEVEDDAGPNQVYLDGDDVDVRVTLRCDGPTPAGDVVVDRGDDD
ncbi:hypothetical protein ACLFMI_07630 [Pseudonocardia nantongensis]|uniref:hypothetical protein n=1 Tax=Pseudonocardia nantongensis TaxID=1181885 RepID=UPI00397AF072